MAVKFYFTLALLLLVSELRAQNDEEELKIIEKYIENSDQAGDYNDLSEQYFYNQSRKIDLNKASAMLLLQIRNIKPREVQAILQHRLEYGKFESLLELQTLDALSPENIQSILPFVSLGENPMEVRKIWEQIKTADKSISTLMSTSYPTSRAYRTYLADSTPYYPGSPYRYQIRAKANFNQGLHYGFSAEKDAGEDFFKASNSHGFDFYSAHVFLQGKTWLKKVALGDFQAGFGQGLTLGSGLAFGKSASVLSIKRYNYGLRPYRSFDENAFLRGAAITVGGKKWESSLLCSRKRIDGNTDTVFGMGTYETKLTSFVTDGNHRSRLEISKEKTVVKSLIGHDLQFTFSPLKIGLNSLFYHLNTPLSITDKVYNAHYFSGRQFFKTGLYFDYYVKNLNCFGEISTDMQHAPAYLVGLYLSIAGNVDLTVVNRRFPKSFVGYQSNAFSENSQPNNEQGTYIGLNIKLNKKLSFVAYLDQYQSAWYSYTSDGPGRGLDYLAELDYKPNKTTLMLIRLRTKRELTNLPLEHYNSLGWNEKTGLRLHCEFKISNAFTLKARLEFSNFANPSGNPTNGHLLYLDCGYKLPGGKLSMSSRATFFNISDYNARIYSVEKNVLYAWSVPGFSGSGTKVYAFINYRMSRKWHLQGRYAVTGYIDKQSIGSGYDEVSSHKIKEINLLITYGFR